MPINQNTDHEAKSELERVCTDEEWFIAARERALYDIILLMMRYEISIDDLATLTRGQRYDRKD